MVYIKMNIDEEFGKVKLNCDNKLILFFKSRYIQNKGKGIVRKFIFISFGFQVNY